MPMPNPSRPPRSTPGVTVSYRGATEDELRDGSRARRILALADQRRLFPRHGELELGEDVMELGGWRRLTREQVTGVELTFTAAYSRLMAAGARGNSPSFGAFGSLGKPLGLEAVGEARVYLLLGYAWWSGINQNREWYPRIVAWAGDPRADESDRRRP